MFRSRWQSLMTLGGLIYWVIMDKEYYLYYKQASGQSSVFTYNVSDCMHDIKTNKARAWEHQRDAQSSVRRRKVAHCSCIRLSASVPFIRSERVAALCLAAERNPSRSEALAASSHSTTSDHQHVCQH